MPSELPEIFLLAPGGSTDARGQALGQELPRSWHLASQQHGRHGAPPCLERAPDTGRGGGSLGVSLGGQEGWRTLMCCSLPWAGASLGLAVSLSFSSETLWDDE